MYCVAGRLKIGCSAVSFMQFSVTTLYRDLFKMDKKRKLVIGGVTADENHLKSASFSQITNGLSSLKALVDDSREGSH